MNFCMDTCFAAKAFVLPDQHRKFVGGGVNSEMLIATETDLMSTFSFQVINAKFKIIGNGEVRIAASVFIDKLTAFLAAKKATVCRVPPWLPA